MGATGDGDHLGHGSLDRGNRFAGVNRLCIDLGYQGSVRRIEPYSLRRTRDGHIVLHAVRRDTGEPRSYRIDRIQSARVTKQPFVPAFPVEFWPSPR